MARIAAVDLEKRFFEYWKGLAKEERVAAMKVLELLHPHLPDHPRKVANGAVEPEQAAEA